MSESAETRSIDVPRILEPDQVRAYLDDGYLVVPNLVDPDELDELKRDIVKVARGGYPAESNMKSVPATLTDAEVLETVLCIHQPHFISPVIEKYVRHPRICGVLSQIAAAHLPWWDGSVKCMQSMFFVKPPGFQGQGWHQDEVYIPTRDRSLVGAWIAIDDATVENGCLWVLPGSHRDGYLHRMRQHDNDDEFDGAEEAFGFDETSEIPVEVKAGTLVFFNGYLLHRSRRNRSDIYRRVLVNHYMNAWSLLPWHPGDDPPARADERAIIHVAGVDPYAWKGFGQPQRRIYSRMCKANEESLEENR
ncbi:MAG: phytanoyl-CoA dioxygenase [Phycisphaeraceae bacterium]|nr:phytanoyl-CoA dioxygenase [Phycisphaeraceae bacterium]